MSQIVEGTIGPDPMPGADASGKAPATASAKGKAKKRQRSRLLLFFGSSGRSQPASGPPQSITAMANGLAKDFDIQIISSPGVFENVPSSAPEKRNDRRRSAQHVCFSAGAGSWNRLAHLVKNTRHDCIHLNSFFDRDFTLPILVMRKLGLVPHTPVVLSPRGEFAQGALSIKSRRKQVFIRLVRRFRLLNDVWLHATADHEADDIERQKLGARGILSAPDVAQLFDLPAQPAKPATNARLRIAFVGRLTPVKNLAFALDVLSCSAAAIDFDIYGPVGDARYWETCQKKIAKMPGRVQIGIKGTIPNSAIPAMLAGYDLFFLPTLGENFGQAIHEALASGVPVMISDRTAWRGLAEHGAGWDLPLDQPQRFVQKINALAAMDHHERSWHRVSARRFAERRHVKDDAIAKHRAMFRRVLKNSRQAS